MTGVFNGIPLRQLQNLGSNNQERRFKSLPPAESLPRHEPLGGYIFVCNNDTMEDDLRRRLFGLPQRYRDSVRAIQPGLPLFLYNYTTHQLHGVYEATSFGGSNLDPNAWEDKKSKGESRFPAQVRIKVRKQCSPLDEDHFRPILHHYDGPKFRLQLSVQETLDLLDLFDVVTASSPVTSTPPPSPPTAPGRGSPATTPGQNPSANKRALHKGVSPARPTGIRPNGTNFNGPIFGPFGSPLGSMFSPGADVDYFGTSLPLFGDSCWGPSSMGYDPGFAWSFPPGIYAGHKGFEMASYARVMRPVSMV